MWIHAVFLAGQHEQFGTGDGRILAEADLDAEVVDKLGGSADFVIGLTG